jgi:hypothetical protein
VSDGHDVVAEQTERDETLLFIVKAIVSSCCNRAGKYCFAIDKIDAVLLEIAPTLATGV